MTWLRIVHPIGTRFVCNEGHQVATAVRDIMLGAAIFPDDLGEMQPGLILRVGEPFGTCTQCGAPFTALRRNPPPGLREEGVLLTEADWQAGVRLKP
ncbi:MAG: hypothetical protein AB7K67_01010 [Hyphomicrobiaceae bacterium]